MDWFLYDRDLRHERVNGYWNFCTELKTSNLCVCPTNGIYIFARFNDSRFND